MLQDERVQLVSVVTPTGTHIDIGTRVLDSGRHLLLEKPLDVDLARALGVASVGWWRSQAYYDSAPWRGTWAQDGGGALMNQGIHTLDLLLWFLGEPVRVTASSRRIAHQRIEVEDTLAAVVEFSSGALATVHATTAAYPGLAARLQIMGTTGSAIIEHEGLSYLHLANNTHVGDMGLHGAGNQVIAPNHACHRDATTNASGHARQFADLEDAVRSGGSPLATIADAVKTLATIHAIYRAASTGVAVELAEVIASPTFSPYRVGAAEHHVQR
ncbi:1,5-anhydro-D-fructose reductase [Arthrobacter ulcerisalmonis]|uniref:1,5-anhydro-D-fructose reductase n=1 Tax=Arthrobacter ulcerisalmonis TaxID=2483813 RepID=A0A3P5WKG9_9MICC|nr:1,5-anhydro-D-fructose reductase [Arthrobacter ulcerisalmonis]